LVHILNVDDLVKKAKEHYMHALKLLDSGDIYDAAEKAWLAIETLRKAFLVAVGVPCEKTKSISYSLPLFNRLLRALGLRELLRNYEFLYFKLHAMGFYENITPIEDLIHSIRVDTASWIKNMEVLINKVRGVNISNVLKDYDEVIKLKREIIAKNVELMKLYQNINSSLSKLLEPIRISLTKDETSK